MGRGGRAKLLLVKLKTTGKNGKNASLKHLTSFTSFKTHLTKPIAQGFSQN